MSQYLVTDPQLPPQLPTGVANGEREYYRRRIDELVDTRLHGIEAAIRSLDVRADTLDRRLNWIFGGLAVLSVIVNLAGPFIARALTGEP